MTPGLNFLRADTIIQRILFAFYIFTGLSVLINREALIFLMIVQFFLGGWQLLSSIILIAIRRDQKRITYLASVLVYFALLIAGGSLVSKKVISDPPILMIIGMVICPMAIAVWYFITSEKDYQEAKRSPQAAIRTRTGEQILDEGLWE